MISILVPVYNVEQYLLDSIESLITNNISGIEIIIVDDGSTDDSALLCDNLIQKYPNLITVAHQVNYGLIQARRSGLKLGRGDYYAFLDSDDKYARDFLSRVEKVINEHHPDLIMYGFNRVDRNGIHSFNILDIDEGLYSYDKINIFKHYFIATNKINNLWIKVASRQCIDIWSDYSKFSEVTIGEDILQSLPIIDLANRIYYIPQALYFYYKNAASMTSTGLKKQYSSLKTVYNVEYDYINKWGCSEYQDEFLKKYNRMVCNYLAGLANIPGPKNSFLSIYSAIKDINADYFFLESRRRKAYMNATDMILTELTAHGFVSMMLIFLKSMTMLKKR